MENNWTRLFAETLPAKCYAELILNFVSVLVTDEQDYWLQYEVAHPIKMC